MRNSYIGLVLAHQYTSFNKIDGEANSGDHAVLKVVLRESLKAA